MWQPSGWSAVFLSFGNVPCFFSLIRHNAAGGRPVASQFPLPGYGETCGGVLEQYGCFLVTILPCTIDCACVLMDDVAICNVPASWSVGQTGHDVTFMRRDIFWRDRQAAAVGWQVVGTDRFNFDEIFSNQPVFLNVASLVRSVGRTDHSMKFSS